MMDGEGDGDGCLGAYFGIAYVVRVHAQRNVQTASMSHDISNI